MLSDQTQNSKFNSLFNTFGQFVVHDVSFSPVNGIDSFIPVPKCDVDFDIKCTNKKRLDFTRLSLTKRKTISNGQSSFLDLSSVYGFGEQHESLRDKDGKMKLSDLDLLPLEDDEFVSGDLRSQENLQLNALHVLFVREHNRRAEMIKTDLMSDEEVFQNARKWTIAVYQNIVFNEWIPALLNTNLPEYKGYNGSIDPSIEVFFFGAAMRYGHSGIPSNIALVNEFNTTFVGLKTSLGKTDYIKMNGIEDVLRGGLVTAMQEIDTNLQKDIQDLEFFPFDLAATNIMRGRDLGLAKVNDLRQKFKLPKLRNFNDLSNDTVIVKKLRVLYKTLDDVDPFVACLLDQNKSGILGALPRASIQDQFLRLRDGDSNFFQASSSGFRQSHIDEILKFRFSDLVLQNTEIKIYPKDALTRAPIQMYQIPNILFEKECE